MKRLLTVCISLLIFSAPAFAQDATIDPAAYLPADTGIYVEIRTDESSLSTLNLLASFSSSLSRPFAPSPGDVVDSTLTPLLSSLLPGIDARADVFPWVTDRIGISAEVTAFPGLLPGSSVIFVLPIREPAGAQAFVQRAAWVQRSYGWAAACASTACLVSPLLKP
ncbi:MAG: hypothetical protein ABI835_01600 [Chloroflexota bacterium]